MKDLLNEYRYTLWKTENELKHLINVGEEYYLEHINNDSKAYKKIRKHLGSIISDLKYTIEWLEDGRQPGLRRGITRRSVEQVTITSEIATIDAMEYKRYVTTHQAVSEEIDRETNLIHVFRQLLTERQFDILEMHAQGLPAHYIANKLDISKSTVRNHLKVAFEKVKGEIFVNSSFVNLHEAVSHFVQEQERKQTWRYMEQELTIKQFEVFQLYFEGNAKSEIAKMLHTSDAYISKVIGKCSKLAEQKGWAI